MRIVLVTGEPIFRIGLRSVIESTADVHVVADAADARSAFRAVDAEHPEVVVIDVALPGRNGLLRGAAAPRGDIAQRTVILLMDDQPEMRSALVDELLADGYRRERSSGLTAALREVRGLEVLAAALPRVHSPDQFAAALGRAVARRRFPSPSASGGSPLTGASGTSS